MMYPPSLVGRLLPGRGPGQGHPSYRQGQGGGGHIRPVTEETGRLDELRQIVWAYYETIIGH